MGNHYINICYVNPGINIRRPISFIMSLLKKKRYRISILTPREKSNVRRENTRHYDDFRDINLLTYPVWTKSSGFIWPIPTNLDFFRKGWKILKENDIIHVWVPFYPNTFIICLLKLLFFRKKKLILTMDTFPAYSFGVSSILDVLFKIFFKTLGKLAFIASNCVVVYGDSFVKYAENSGVPKRKIRVTPTGIQFKPKSSDENISYLLNIKTDEKIVLFIGLHNKRKGIDLIIKTAILLREENIKFVLVGDGPEREKSIKLVSSLGLSEKIKFLGNRLDVHNFYNQADIFFFPSRGEGLPGVLMEAMIYQVPIVSSNIPGVRDLIKHMENGILCETEDIICYKKAIKRLLRDEKLRNKFKENGINTIKSKYLWKNNLLNFESIYKKLVLN
ncbi:MAG: glycosyltransferase family 4 protein [Candidatus Lokiarchaeota archaeon]|nr:glycosyltransferase family 4 protein [Candidatus Lokiarchaeota archaeon]